MSLPFVPSFTFENADTNIPNLASHFAIQPQRGVLAASERPVHVHLVFHPKAEINIKDKPILKCQVSCPRQVGITLGVSRMFVLWKERFSWEILS